jgi:hypothetical protein
MRFPSYNSTGNILPGIRLLCTLKADLSGLAHLLRPQTGLNGKKYWRVPVQLVIDFGGTKLRARLKWEEDVSLLLI